MKNLFLLTLAIGGALAGQAQRPADWLIDPAPFKAQVTENKGAHELVLENGVVRRVIRLAPGAATVDLQNLTTGEHVLRALAPEARVTIDGVPYAVGGLRGQPVANYIKAEWLASLTADLQAYRFAGWSEGPIEAHFPWQKRSEWMARDLPWPPKGRHVVMRYLPPAGPPGELAAPAILEEDFSGATVLKPEWKVRTSKGFDRASFVNEGKAGEVMAPSAGSVCAEHAWPAGAQSVEVLMSSGDDRSAAWGPGLALVTEAGVVRFITRPGEGRYEAHGEMGGTFNRQLPCRLRVRLEQGAIIFEAAQAERPFTIIGTAPAARPPSAIRVGKVGMNGSGEDAGADTSPSRSFISKVTWRAAERVAVAPARADLPAVEVHYNIYDGIPLLSKWLVVSNTTRQVVRLNRFVAEELRFAEPEMNTGLPPTREHPNLHVETDYSFGDMNAHYANPAVTVGPDPEYPTQVNYAKQTPCLLICTPPAMGPDVDIAPGGTFESFRAYVLLLDSSDREVRTLAQRRMYRTVAPWTAENPLMFHKIQSDPATIRAAIDQAAEVGFELVIMSFGSGFNFESTDPAYIARYKELADYGKSKGIALGGYSLLASRGAATAVENTQGQPTAYGVMPCLGAQWGRDYLAKIRNVSAQAGFGVFENDGSYPGDRCAATNHPFHHGLADSQWVQWRAITDLYKWCTGNGVYLNIPDWYFLAGATKCAMHYRESNWSLPRAEQELIERQNIFDGTWNKTASMGWMFVPLSEYQGGGAAATIEPLKDHLPHYEARLANLLGAGVQACYRGPRLYDTDETKALVAKWVSFYKAHREVLDGDIIHLRRANGLDWDGILHVNPQGKEKGLAFFYNPLPEAITRIIRVPLYYAGLSERARVSVEGAASTPVMLDRSETATLEVKVPARGRTWIVFAQEGAP
jgi:hypothetical protein